MDKKLIILDCYGTLLTNSNGKAYSIFLQENQLSMKDYYDLIMTTETIDWKKEVDFDKITESSYLKSTENFCANILEDISSIKPYLENMSEYLAKLREHHVVVVLSNLSKEYSSPINTFISNNVDKVFLSYEIGHKKPTPEAFYFVKDWYKENYGNIEDKNIIVADDSHNNIKYIRTTGMVGIHVSNGNIDSPYSIKAFFDWILK
jgi:FMN phosphatase YigB (HAD superfamily)